MEVAPSAEVLAVVPAILRGVLLVEGDGPPGLPDAF